MKKLPVWPTARDAFAFVWRRRRQFFAIALPLVVLIALISALIVLAFSLFGGYADLSAGEVRLWVFLLVEIPAWLFAATAWVWIYFASPERVSCRAAWHWIRANKLPSLTAAAFFSLVSLVLTWGYLVGVLMLAIGTAKNPAADKALIIAAVLAGCFILVLFMGYSHTQKTTTYILSLPSIVADLCRGGAHQQAMANMPAGGSPFVRVLMTTMPFIGWAMAIPDPPRLSIANMLRLFAALAVIWLILAAVALPFGVGLAGIFQGTGAMGTVTGTFLLALILQFFVFYTLSVGMSAIAIAFDALE